MNKSISGVTGILVSLVLILILLAITACSSGPATSGAAGKGQPTSSTSTTTGAAKLPANTTIGASGKGSISAKIDGTNWTSAETSAKYNGTGLTITGADISNNTARALGLGVPVPGPGTYQISPQNPAALVSLTIGSAVWQTGSIGGSGTVTIDSLTSTGASGTFSLDMVPVPNTSASGNKVVTEGGFNVTFSSPVNLPAQPSTSASITARIKGVAWNGTTAHVVFQNQSLNIVGIGPKNGSITLNINKVTGPGTYSLAYLNSAGSSAIYSNSAAQGFDTALPGGTGSAIITTLTPTRVVGTFNFDAPPASGSSGVAIQITIGKFDLTY